jgi:hypothetical protein
MPEPRLPFAALLFRTVVCGAFLLSGVGVVAALVATKPDAGRNPEAAPPPRIAVL